MTLLKIVKSCFCGAFEKLGLDIYAKQMLYAIRASWMLLEEYHANAMNVLQLKADLPPNQ